jgi:hypothetical protein
VRLTRDWLLTYSTKYDSHTLSLLDKQVPPDAEVPQQIESGLAAAHRMIGDRRRPRRAARGRNGATICHGGEYTWP